MGDDSERRPRCDVNPTLRHDKTNVEQPSASEMQSAQDAGSAAPPEDLATQDTPRRRDLEGDATTDTVPADMPEREVRASAASDGKKSAAEALTELCQAIDHLGGTIEDLHSFTEQCKERLFRDADEVRADGMRAVVESLMRVHDLAFRQVQAAETGHGDTGSFGVTLLETIEAELDSHGVEVIRPQPGDTADLFLMRPVREAPCPFWRSPNRVAQTHSCGFVQHHGSRSSVFKKAEITLYTK